MIRALVSTDAWDAFGPRLTASLPNVNWDLLQPDGRTTTRLHSEERRDADVVWLTHDVFMREQQFDLFDLCKKMSNLRWIQSAAASANAAPLLELLSRGVRISTSHVTGVSIAEFVFGAVLEYYQDRRLRVEAVRERVWKQRDFREVAGTTWLVVGFGSIGAQVGVRAQAFGAHVIGVRNRPRGDEAATEMISLADVRDHVSRADVVVLCIPPGPDTDGLVDQAFLERMRPGSVLVNVARASLINEISLMRALELRAPEYAILDVFNEEPLPASSELWSHPSVAVSPHTAGCGSGRYERAAEIFITNFERYLRSEELLYELNSGRTRRV